jgi:hypothetical protein
MSHEVKYIGMDVQKEAIMIAVQNGTGNLLCSPRQVGDV